MLVHQIQKFTPPGKGKLGHPPGARPGDGSSLASAWWPSLGSRGMVSLCPKKKQEATYMWPATRRELI